LIFATLEDSLTVLTLGTVVTWS